MCCMHKQPSQSACSCIHPRLPIVRQLPHAPSRKTRAVNSPHINRRLRSTSTHDLSKPAQLRRPWTQSRRRSQRSSSGRHACKASRSSSSSRVVWQSETPSCAIAKSRLLRILESRRLARGGAVGLLRLLGGVGGHVHRSHVRGRSGRLLIVEVSNLRLAK